MYQIKLLSPEHQERIQEISSEFLGKADLDSEEIEDIASLLHYNRCILVDPDEDSSHKIRAALTAIGFADILYFKDPVKALGWIRKNGKPDLLITEWALPALPGPIFLYKLYNRLGIQTPTLVCNAKLTDKDSMLIQELGVTKVIRKPFSEEEIKEAIIWTLKEELNPKSPTVLMKRLRHALNQKDDEATRLIRDQIARTNSISPGQMKQVEAEIAYANSCFQHAKKHALEALSYGNNTIDLLELLSRAMMKLRDFDGALRVLDNVKLMSPFNVNHLCSIAECHLETGDDSNFDKVIAEAKQIDSTDERVIETEAKGALKRGHIETARKLLEQLRSFKEVLAFMNNRAVTMIRTGNFHDGIDLYQQALKALPLGKKELKAVVLYNLGLAYARSDQLEEAVNVLTQSENCQNATRRKKIKHLKKRIIRSIEKGSPLVLNTKVELSESEEAEKMQELKEIERGMKLSTTISSDDYCLASLYKTALGHEEAEAVMAKQVAFNLRGTIKKDFRGIKIESAM